MKILIIDRDPMFSSLLASKMRAAGHEVIEKTIKNEGIEELETQKIDAIYFDPSPLNDPKPILLQIRRIVQNYPYTVLMSEGIDRRAAIRAGCNDGLAKPLDPEALTLSLTNAERMGDLVRRIGDESYDFPSAGGVISKSAFNQLFRSAIDRVGRYSELSHVLFVRIPNYSDIKLDDGKYAADYAVSKLAQNFVRLRRQSDIMGQTDMNEYALLLQRPLTDTESMDAAKRFAQAMNEQNDITSNGVTDVRVEISLIHLPTGSLDFEFLTIVKGQGARSAG